MFCQKGALNIFGIFTGKHQCWSLLLTKLQAWKPTTLLKRDSDKGGFLWIFQISKEQLFNITSLVATSKTPAPFGGFELRIITCKHFLWDMIYDHDVISSNIHKVEKKEISFKKIRYNVVIMKTDVTLLVKHNIPYRKKKKRRHKILSVKKFRHWQNNSSHFIDEFFWLAVWKH